ncbi:MAG: FAD-dependent oxidoreductase [Spirochaetales bacterium]|nr:FAD-dependent oxidoreductase [Spirochaetales bacterium]
MMNKHWEYLIIGTGPAGLGAAFEILSRDKNSKILMLDREKFSTGGLRNDCKMNFTYPVGFPQEYWEREQATHYLNRVENMLKPPIKAKQNLDVYQNRCASLNVELLDIRQAHLGTDGGLELIKELTAQLQEMGVTIELGREVLEVTENSLRLEEEELTFDKLIIAPGRKGFRFLQSAMKNLDIPFIDNIVDVGIRVETEEQHYPIVRDYYDPKFHFQEKVRTFCTNSGCAHVVREKYTCRHGNPYYSVNGHAYSKKEPNGLVNFAMLKTVRLTEPLASGQDFAEMLGQQAALLGGGKPIMQRVGDFRLGRRSKAHSFTGDLYSFKPTLACTPGDISLVMPAKILRAIWKSMKELDTIIPGILHPSTIMYYPEIKLYANKPQFADDHFRVKENVWMIGDGAGTSRGITAAWASGIRAVEGMF